MPFLSLIIILLVVFGALALLLRFVLMKNINSASGHLQDAMADADEKLANAKQKLDEAEKYHQEVMTKAQNEAEQIREQLIQEGRAAKDELLQQAHEQAQELVERAKKTAKSLETEVEDKIQVGAVKKAHQLVSHLLSGTVAEETHTRWVEQLLKNGMEGIEKMKVSPDVMEAHVTTAFPLSDREREQLNETLQKKMGRRFLLHETIDSNLILGLSIKIENIVLDGSLRFKIQESLRKEPL